jgi:putative transposase
MPRMRLSSEQIVAKLRQIEVLLAQEKDLAAACKEADIWVVSQFQ